MAREMARKTFDEVVLFARTGLNPRTNFKLGQGSNKYITIKNIHDNTIVIDENTDLVDDEAIRMIHRRSQINKGDVLFCSIGRMGDMYIIEEDPVGWDINESVFAFTLDTSIIRQKYFYYIFKNGATIEYLSKNSSGSTFKSIKMNQLKKMVFDLPPLDKQDHIVRLLDNVSLIIAMRQKELQQLDDLIKARFVEMFGDPVLNQKRFPVYRMDEVVEFQGGSQPDKKYFEYEPTPDNIRLIQIRDYKTDNYITYIPKSMAKRYCTAEDIMIGRYGPPIFQILQGIEGSFNVALMKATPKIGNREFIRYFLKQECLLQYLEGMSKRTAGQDGIQMDKLKAYPFPMPPSEDQELFEKFVKQTDKSKCDTSNITSATQYQLAS